MYLLMNGQHVNQKVTEVRYKKSNICNLLYVYCIINVFSILKELNAKDSIAIICSNKIK